MEQEKVWDRIASTWNEYRKKPSIEVVTFLKGKKGKILDLGCGSGRNFSSFSKDSQIYAIDFSKEMLKLAKLKSKDLGLKIESFHSNGIPIKDNFFDSGICIAVLHCIQTEKARQKMIDEFYRVLKLGAEALIMVWSKNSPRLKNKPKENFIPWTSAGVEKRYNYTYDKQEIEQKVMKAGFEIVNSKENKNIILTVRKPS